MCLGGELGHELEIITNDYADSGRTDVSERHIVVACAISDSVALTVHGESGNEDDIDLAALRARRQTRLHEAAPPLLKISLRLDLSKPGPIPRLAGLHEGKEGAHAAGPKRVKDRAQVDLASFDHRPKESHTPSLLNLRERQNSRADLARPSQESAARKAPPNRLHTGPDLFFRFPD